MKGFGGEVGEEKDEFDGSLPLPSSPPSHAPRPRYTEPHTSSNQEKLVFIIKYINGRIYSLVQVELLKS